MKKHKTLLYLEFRPDRIFYINGFDKDVITQYLAPDWEPTGLYALWSDFDSIFRKTTTVPDEEKFFYPIVISRWELQDIFDQIEIEEKIIQRVKLGQCKILMICPFEGWTWSWWDGLAEKLKSKYSLLNEHIVFVSANYAPHPHYKTITFNTWERQIFANYSPPEHLIRSQSSVGNLRTHKFICLNRRPSIHRYAVVTNLFEYQDQGILTCALKGSYSDWYQNWVEQNFIAEYPELTKKYRKRVRPALPLKFDDGINPEVDNPAANEWGKIDKYYDSYLYVVTETFFENKAQGENTLFLSEKIFKPIIFFQPFVAFARPGTLKLMRRLGYQTFGDFIDESYDSVDNDKERMYKAIDSIKNIIAMSHDQLQKMMLDMKPIFEHNYSNLKTNYDINIFANLKRDLHTCLHGVD